MARGVAPGMLGVMRPVVDFRDQDAAALLAGAARSTSSFPVAFEPHRLRLPPRPVEPEPASGEENAPLTTPGSAEWHWLIDGGVLDNQPFNPVLDRIAVLPPEGKPTKRVVSYVVPYVNEPGSLDAATPEATSALASYSASGGLPRTLSKLQSLDRVTADWAEQQIAQEEHDEALGHPSRRAARGGGGSALRWCMCGPRSRGPANIRAMGRSELPARSRGARAGSDDRPALTRAATARSRRSHPLRRRCRQAAAPRRAMASLDRALVCRGRAAVAVGVCGGGAGGSMGAPVAATDARRFRRGSVGCRRARRRENGDGPPGGQPGLGHSLREGHPPRGVYGDTRRRCRRTRASGLRVGQHDSRGASGALRRAGRRHCRGQRAASLGPRASTRPRPASSRGRPKRTLDRRSTRSLPIRVPVHERRDRKLARPRGQQADRETRRDEARALRRLPETVLARERLVVGATRRRRARPPCLARPRPPRRAPRQEGSRGRACPTRVPRR